MSFSTEFSTKDSGLCIVCHDAGGAELLANWMVREGRSCQLLLAGPAVRVFERVTGQSLKIIDLKRALQECECFLTGTSWQSDLEWRTIRAARAQRKTVVTYLDHWGHYRERFIRYGEECLPDAIWAGDEDAFSMVKTLFPDVQVEYVPNPYFENICKTVAELGQGKTNRDVNSTGLRILFVCEPLSEHGLKEFGDSMHWGYTEFDALRFFFSHLEVLGCPVEGAVIRPHPSEKNGKYDAIVRELANSTGVPLRVGGAESLAQEIARCDVVAGCESMAMVVGLIAGRRVVCAIPPGGLPCSLPHQKIESLQSILID